MRASRLTRFTTAVAAGLAIAGAFGTAAAAGAPAAPTLLSETGLYADVASLQVDPRNLPFEPQYPLWTDGAEKTRWIRLPDGATIDASDAGNWILPAGTKLWKEFAFDGSRVETRMIWRASESDWVYATYVWNDEQTDAMLAPAAGIRNHARISDKARHSIPAASDCASCHDATTRPVLGFSAIQLSDDRDPLAPHAKPLEDGTLTISALERLGLLSPRRPDLVASPPRIAASSPRERAVLGYLSTNCGSCHNSLGALSMLGMTLAHDGVSSNGTVAPARATTVEVSGYWKVPSVDPALSKRVAPGEPDASAIVYRMNSTHPSSRMPPIGTTVVDEQALELIRAWIASDLRPDAATEVSSAE